MGALSGCVLRPSAALFLGPHPVSGHFRGGRSNGFGFVILFWEGVLGRSPEYDREQHVRLVEFNSVHLLRSIILGRESSIYQNMVC